MTTSLTNECRAGDELCQKLVANDIDAAPARDDLDIADATRGAELSRTVMPQISDDVLTEPGDPVPINNGLSNTVSTDSCSNREPPCFGVHNDDRTWPHVSILPADYSARRGLSPPM